MKTSDYARECLKRAVEDNELIGNVPTQVRIAFSERLTDEDQADLDRVGRLYCEMDDVLRRVRAKVRDWP